MAPAPKNDLLFICNQCGRCGRYAQVATACPSCSNTTFRVARTGRNPTFEDQLHDPYNRDVEEDGPNMTQIGGNNDPISSSGFGQNSRGDQNGNDEISVIRHDDIQAPANNLPGDHDGLKDDVDVREGDPLQSPAFSADNSPFNTINNKREPLHIGPFNMHKSPASLLAPSVYERVRRKRREAI